MLAEMVHGKATAQDSWFSISHDTPFTLCSLFKPFLTYGPEAQSTIHLGNL